MAAKKPTVYQPNKVGTGSITNCDECGGTHAKVDIYLKGFTYFAICPKTKKRMEFKNLL